MRKLSYLFRKLEGNKVQCLTCSHFCVLEENQRGKCGVRVNKKGELYFLLYEKACSANIDPIEKKPLYHFLPGNFVFSIGTFGCNFSCLFCQNWEIAQASEQDISTSELKVRDVPYLSGSKHSIGIAYTYNEPTVWYEFIKNSAPLVKEKGLKVILVTNGFINPQPFKQLAPYIDAMNIDLKAFNNEFYIKYTGGTLYPVLKTIENIGKLEQKLR